jgi:hypothetical protein
VEDVAIVILKKTVATFVPQTDVFTYPVEVAQALVVVLGVAYSLSSRKVILIH